MLFYFFNHLFLLFCFFLTLDCIDLDFFFPPYRTICLNEYLSKAEMTEFTIRMTVYSIHQKIILTSLQWGKRTFLTKIKYNPADLDPFAPPCRWFVQQRVRQRLMNACRRNVAYFSYIRKKIGSECLQALLLNIIYRIVRV